MRRKGPSARAPERPSVFLGIDAGGSHTEAVVMDAAERVLARSRGATGAVGPGRIAAAARVISTVARSALKQAKAGATADAVVVGAAGAGRSEERAALEAKLRSARLTRRLRVTTDGEIALESVFPSSPGILLIAGTGSSAFGRGAPGTVRRVGGLGWQIGDEGSGYWLGRACLAAAGRAADDRGPPTLLRDMIPRAVGTADLHGLVRWAQGATRTQVGALAKVACDAAREGDPLARELIESTAHELAEHVVALLRRLTPHPPRAIALTGGLLAPESAVRARTIAALARVAPELAIVETPVDPALGAARLAARL